MSENAAHTTEQMQMPKHGQICWTEIATKNLEISSNFYTELFGWNLLKSNAVGPEMEYIEFAPEGSFPIGGMYEITEECGNASAHWMSYVAVDNVDESAEKVKQLGGTIKVPPTDIPNVGRFCVITDPTGATFSLITMNPWN
ncbi:MAG TPA: VOC family protein [Pyrinomonadaceae bacterium]|jgi:hypothetical protein